MACAARLRAKKSGAQSKSGCRVVARLRRAALSGPPTRACPPSPRLWRVRRSFSGGGKGPRYRDFFTRSSAERERRSALAETGRLLECVSQLQHTEIVAAAADDLNTDRQPL